MHSLKQNFNLIGIVTQIYGFCRPTAASQVQQQVSACIDDVALWMWSNRLQVNITKTEVLWCASSRWQHQLPQVALRVGTDYVTPTTSVCDLGIYVDSDVSMRASTCPALCPVTSLHYASCAAFVGRRHKQYYCCWSSRWCCRACNTTLAGLPGNQLDRLQSVMNAAARLVLRRANITPLLRDLHWLRVPERIEFKLSVLVFRCLHGTAPPYLASELRRMADVDTRKRL